MPLLRAGQLLPAFYPLTFQCHENIPGAPLICVLLVVVSLPLRRGTCSSSSPQSFPAVVWDFACRGPLAACLESLQRGSARSAPLRRLLCKSISPRRISFPSVTTLCLSATLSPLSAILSFGHSLRWDATWVGDTEAPPLHALLPVCELSAGATDSEAVTRSVPGPDIRLLFPRDLWPGK